MKKLIFSVLAFSVFLFPSLAQIDHDYNINDREPVVSEVLTKDKVPVAVLKASQTQFDMSNSATWSKFPYALKEYGWVYDVGSAGIKLDRYEVKMKTKQGDDLWAVYTANGDLVESREIANNVPLPENIRQALSKSQYKDWLIVGDKEIIRFYRDHNNSNVEQHFRLTVEKDNVKRSISFNYQANNY